MIDKLLIVGMILCALVALFGIFVGIPMAIKQSAEFADRCDAQGGRTIYGKSIRLCIAPDGRILEGE